MMGTEGRCPGRNLMPSDDTYDLVVFKSADIQDLQIVEVQSTQIKSINVALSKQNDQTKPHSRLQFGTTASDSVWSSEQSPTFESLDTNQELNTSNELSHIKKPHPISSPRVISDSQVHSNRNIESKRVPRTLDNESLFPKNSVVDEKKSYNEIHKKNNSVNLSRSHQREENISKTDSQLIENHDSHSKLTTAIGESGVKHYSTANKKIENTHRETRSFASVLSDGSGSFKASSNESSAPIVPGNDFDFTQSNAKLEKVSLNSEIISPGTVYYEKSSFFDNISCDSLSGRGENRDYNERRRNIETFGTPAPQTTYSQHHKYGGYSSTSSSRGGHMSGRGAFHYQTSSRQKTTNVSNPKKI